jgi:hypothetical protein
MNNTLRLQEAISLALQLGTKERLQLIEQIAASVERDIDRNLPNQEPPTEHWGQNLLRLLDEFGPIELDHPEIDDPVEWVKQIRYEQATHRNLDWNKGY